MRLLNPRPGIFFFLLLAALRPGVTAHAQATTTSASDHEEEDLRKTVRELALRNDVVVAGDVHVGVRGAVEIVAIVAGDDRTDQ